VCVAGFSLWRTGAATDHLVGELVDQHVVALSSVNPVDVISEDRHTVKPWFQGKLPFAFNLPELAGTNVTLIGGKLVYLQQQARCGIAVPSGPAQALGVRAARGVRADVVHQERDVQREAVGRPRVAIRPRH
jgi:hypothetical protein